MEMITQMISYIARRASHEESNERTSDGLRLAVELDSAIKAIRELETFDNLRLPKTSTDLSPKPERVAGANRSWVKDRYDIISQASIDPVL